MIDIDKVREEYLKVCGSHDYGLHEYGCTCPESADPRWALQQLCDELEVHRAVARRIAQETRGHNGISGHTLGKLLDQLPT